MKESLIRHQKIDPEKTFDIEMFSKKHDTGGKMFLEYGEDK